MLRRVRLSALASSYALRQCSHDHHDHHHDGHHEEEFSANAAKVWVHNITGVHTRSAFEMVAPDGTVNSLKSTIKSKQPNYLAKWDVDELIIDECKPDGWGRILRKNLPGDEKLISGRFYTYRVPHQVTGGNTGKNWHYSH